MNDPVALNLQQCFIDDRTELGNWDGLTGDIFSPLRFDSLIHARLALQWLRYRGTDRDEHWQPTDLACRVEQLCHWALVYAVHVAEVQALTGDQDQIDYVDGVLARGEVSRQELILLATHLLNAPQPLDPGHHLAYSAAS